MLSNAARLPVDALVRLVRQERIGELPAVLAPAAVWRPRDEVDAAQARAYDEAARLGWIDRRGRLDVDVAESLSVVCRPRVEYYGWIASSGSSGLGVLAAATGREAILAVRDRDEVWLQRAQSKKLADALVAQLPELHPGAGTPVSVPVDELRAAAAWQEQKPGAVSVQPVPRAELRQVLRVIALPTTGSGELWVAVRDSLGRRREILYPLRYADTEWGRFLNLATMTDGGELWMTVAPAGLGELVTRLRNLEHSLTQPAR